MEFQNNSYRKILFVINPIAGDSENQHMKEFIASNFIDDKLIIKIMIMNKKNDDSVLNKLIHEFDPETVVACGGDGTVNFVVNHILDKKIKLGIIPLGSYNGMAYQMGIPNDIKEAARIIKQGKTKSSDVIRINSDYICVHISDLGTNARVIKRYKKDSLKGFKGYVKQYFKELGKTKQFKCLIKTKEKRISKKVAMIIIANAAYYGTGFNINPEAELNDGRFEIILIKSYPFWYLFYIMFTLLRGKSCKEKWTNIIKCNSAEIIVKPEQELQVDGEVAGFSEKISPEILSKQIEILTMR